MTEQIEQSKKQYELAVQRWNEALDMLHKSAETGYDVAQWWLGNYYFYGIGVIQNREIALKWWHKAAEQGFAPAELYLGQYYYDCQGVCDTTEKGMELLRRANKQISVLTQYCFSIDTSTGLPWHRNNEELTKWFQEKSDRLLKAGLDLFLKIQEQIRTDKDNTSSQQ